MKLIFDDFEASWIWVDDADENVELSPRFDEQEYATDWFKAITSEVAGEQQVLLDQLYSGDRVVLPRTRKHAEDLLRVATFYLENNG